MIYFMQETFECVFISLFSYKSILLFYFSYYNDKETQNLMTNLKQIHPDNIKLKWTLD